MYADKLDGLLPSWMRNDASRIVPLFAALLAEAVEDVQLGKVHLLGYDPAHDVVPVLERQRGVYRGFKEENLRYGKRLSKWLQLAMNAGNREQCLDQIAAMFTVPPVIRLVQQAGDVAVWITRDPITGAKTYESVTPSNWDWDGQTLGARWWIILYADPSVDPPLEPASPLGDGMGYYGPTYHLHGIDWPAEYTARLLAVVDEQRPETVAVQVMVTFDPLILLPSLPPGDPGLPDGTWHTYQIVDGVPVSSTPDTVLLLGL